MTLYTVPSSPKIWYNACNIVTNNTDTKYPLKKTYLLYIQKDPNLKQISELKYLGIWVFFTFDKIPTKYT